MRSSNDTPAKSSTAALARAGGLVMAACLAALMVPTPSCVNLLELDGYASAARELCDVLGQCYGAAYVGDCEGHVGGRLDGAGEAEREAWLVYFADHNCLGSCVNARRCLDEPPLCASQHAPCGQTEHCCGFSQGTGDCASRAGGELRCCLPDGLECGTDEECCASECDDAVCADGLPCTVCGGIPCKLAGDSCQYGFECCAGICDPRTGSCSDIICLENGIECVDNFECCSAYCDIPEGVPSGFCDEPSCSFDGEACVAASECCGGHCLEVTDGLWVCSSLPCLTEESPCTGDDQCCTGHCDPTVSLCTESQPCTSVGLECSSSEECCYPECVGVAGQIPRCSCKPGGEPCTDRFECCADDCGDDGNCTGGNCLGYGQPCDPDTDPTTGLACCSGKCGGGICCRRTFCTHAVCRTGVPLSEDCLNCENCQAGNGISCPGLVCADQAYAYCCCDWWDAACVTQAETVCGHTCPPN